VTARSEKRPWLAVVLAFFQPGLGHAYLREWLRALVWFFLYVTSFTWLVDEETIPESFSLDAYVGMVEAMPLGVKLALLSITVFGMLDAYWMAKQRNRASAVDEGTTCPNCGKDLEEDLDFCHWCTEPLPGTEAAEDDADVDA
jgi:hypothetical protein